MKGLFRSLSRGPQSRQQITTLRIPLTNLAIDVADGAPGWGTTVLGALPEGNLLFLGAVAYAQFSTADVDVTATFDGDFSIGTAPTANGDLIGAGEADLIPSTALGAATAGVSTIVRAVSTNALSGTIIDNTDGSLELNLNLLIDDVSISGAATFALSGVLHISMIVLGDD